MTKKMICLKNVPNMKDGFRENGKLGEVVEKVMESHGISTAQKYEPWHVVSLSHARKS